MGLLSTGTLKTALVALVAVAVAMRVAPLRNLIAG